MILVSRKIYPVNCVPQTQDWKWIFCTFSVAFSLTCGLKAEGPPGGAKERLVLDEAVANWLTWKTISLAFHILK